MRAVPLSSHIMQRNLSKRKHAAVNFFLDSRKKNVILILTPRRKMTILRRHMERNYTGGAFK